MLGLTSAEGITHKVNDMTNQEELLYLSDLLMQATLWRVDPDDGKTALELEVEQRIRTLREKLGAKPNEIYGDTAPAGFKPKSPSDNKIRTKGPDGLYHRYDRSEVEQVPCTHSRTGYKWVVKSTEQKEAV